MGAQPTRRVGLTQRQETVELLSRTTGNRGSVEPQPETQGEPTKPWNIFQKAEYDLLKMLRADVGKENEMKTKQDIVKCEDALLTLESGLKFLTRVGIAALLATPIVVFVLLMRGSSIPAERVMERGVAALVIFAMSILAGKFQLDHISSIKVWREQSPA